MFLILSVVVKVLLSIYFQVIGAKSSSLIELLMLMCEPFPTQIFRFSR